MVLERPPPERRVAVFEAAFAPEATVVIPPRTARAPSDAPAPAALPPRLAPAPTADPIVRMTASAGSLTTAGAFSCQIRAPYPATAPSNPATSHSSISAPPTGRLHGQQVQSQPAFASTASPGLDETIPVAGRRGAVARVPAQDPCPQGVSNSTVRAHVEQHGEGLDHRPTWCDVVAGEAPHGPVCRCHRDGMQGVRGSSPLSSTLPEHGVAAAQRGDSPSRSLLGRLAPKGRGPGVLSICPILRSRLIVRSSRSACDL